MWLILLALLVASCSTSTQPTMEAVSPEPEVDAGAEADVSVEASADVGVEADTSSPDTSLDVTSEVPPEASADTIDSTVPDVLDSAIDAPHDAMAFTDDYSQCTHKGQILTRVTLNSCLADCKGQDKVGTAVCYYGCKDNSLKFCEHFQEGIWSPSDNAWGCYTCDNFSLMSVVCTCP